MFGDGVPWGKEEILAHGLALVRIEVLNRNNYFGNGYERELCFIPFETSILNLRLYFPSQFGLGTDLDLKIEDNFFCIGSGKALLQSCPQVVWVRNIGSCSFIWSNWFGRVFHDLIRPK